SPFSSQTIASPSIRNERTGSLLTVVVMKGNRAEKSFPTRAISRTPAASLRAMMRKPSCLISWSQPRPDGGALAADGEHVDDPQTWATTLTQRHGHLIRTTAERVENKEPRPEAGGFRTLGKPGWDFFRGKRGPAAIRTNAPRAPHCR